MSTKVLHERSRSLEILALGARHGFEELATQSIAAGESPGQFRTKLMGRLLMQKLGGTFSFARLVDSLALGRLDGIERETLEDAARKAGQPFDAQRVVLPWSLFSRDLTAFTASAGGYLINTDVGDAIDTLRPWSVTARAGITALENLTGDLTLPRTTAKATPYWLATEGTGATASQPTLGSIAFRPKTAAGLVTFSRQLNKQADVESYVRRELLRTVGTAVDQAVLTGTGASGQPTGLLNTPGLATQSGTALGQAGVVNMKQQAASANAADASIAFIGTPEVRELLETRERATGSGFVWDDDRVASRPAYVSTDVPSATLIAGDWSDVILGLWGAGFVFEVNPYDPTGFKAGTIQARVLVSLDVAIAHPSAFCVASSIT